MELQPPLWTLLGLTAGALVAWMAARAVSRQHEQAIVSGHLSAAAAHQAMAAEATRQLAAVQTELRHTRDALEAVQDESAGLREDNARLQSEIQHHRQAVPEKLALLSEAQLDLKTAFDALAAQALRSNSEEFLKLADQRLATAHTESLGAIDKRQHAIDELIGPIRQTLTQVDQKLQESDRHRAHTSSALETLLRELGQQNERLRGETQSLVRALRSPTVRGRWGEVQLRRVVEMAGLVERCDFDEQRTFFGEDGRLRPDLVVRLPGGRLVVVDAKVPLDAYLTAAEATDDRARGAQLRDHARQVRMHVDRLAGKNYWEQFGTSPEFVIMFLGAEAIYHAALQEDPTLVESAARRRVLLAGPMNLIGLLLVVAQGWRQERMAQNAEEIAALGKELYSRVATMTGHLDDLRKKLDGSVQSYNRVVGAFEGRVLTQVRRFRDLGAAAGDDVPVPEAIDATPRVLQAANLLGLPDEALAAPQEDEELTIERR